MVTPWGLGLGWPAARLARLGVTASTGVPVRAALGGAGVVPAAWGGAEAVLAARGGVGSATGKGMEGVTRLTAVAREEFQELLQSPDLHHGASLGNTDNRQMFLVHRHTVEKVRLLQDIRLAGDKLVCRSLVPADMDHDLLHLGLGEAFGGKEMVVGGESVGCIKTERIRFRNVKGEKTEILYLIKIGEVSFLEYRHALLTSLGGKKKLKCLFNLSCDYLNMDRSKIL